MSRTFESSKPPESAPTLAGAGMERHAVYAEKSGSNQEADQIFSPFRTSCATQPFVVAQLGQSLDGRIATLTGDSKYINGAAALRHLHQVRANVDAVLVGVGTVVADDPLLTVRLCPGRSPSRVILDPRGRVPGHARCVRDRSVETLVVTGLDTTAPHGLEAIRVPSEAGFLDPRAIVEALHRRGFHRILVEGGAHTISNFIDAGAVDRLHVLVAPMILGSGKPGLDLAPIKTLEHALRPATTVKLLDDGNVLFDCDLRRSASEASVDVAPAMAAE